MIGWTLKSISSAGIVPNLHHRAPRQRQCLAQPSDRAHPRALLGRRVALLTRHRGTRAYLVAAVLPLYILHQPIVVAVAYGVVGWDAPIAVKYAAIVAASLVLTLITYDLLVRRTTVTRFLFGMRG